MGEPTVEVKQEDGVDATSVKLEPCSEGEVGAKKVKLELCSKDGPDAKRLKLEPEESEGVKAADKDNGVKGTDNGADVKTEEEKGDPNLEMNVVAQIEYYFGNFNLPKDKFMQEQIKLDNGWIPLEVMLRFQRLSRLSKNPVTIASCLKNSSKLIEVSEDGTKIRRSTAKPLPEMNEEFQKQVNERTVYCKGFPTDLDDIGSYKQFFKQYGPTENINLRRYRDRMTKQSILKGSAYVLFDTKELAEKFLALESVTFQGKELIRMTFDAHSQEKKKEKDERWGKKLKTGVPEEKAKPKKEFAKGCIFKINGIKDEELTRDEIKSTLVNLGADVAFIQYAMGDKEAFVRLQSSEEGAASQFIKKLADKEEKVKFGDSEMELALVEGEDEEAFLQKTRESMEKMHKGMKKGRGYQGRGHHHHKGGHRGGFKGHHKRGRSPVKMEPAD